MASLLVLLPGHEWVMGILQVMPEAPSPTPSGKQAHGLRIKNQYISQD